MKKYLSSYPELAKEWHPTKNGKFSPKDFTYGSQKTVWWLCPKGHAYDRRIGERTRKRNSVCPYCFTIIFGTKFKSDNRWFWLFFIYCIIVVIYIEYLLTLPDF